MGRRPIAGRTVFLLDTCALIWIANGDPLREPAASALADAHDGRIFVSPISAWEIAMLAAKGRLAFSVDPGIWFERFCALPGVASAEMPPSVLIASARLPGDPPDDPADRILAATARAFGYALVTRDGRLFEYAAAGHLRVVGC